MGVDPEWHPRYRQIKDLGYLFSSLSGVSLPLGDSSQYTQDRRQVLATLPTRQVIETLVQRYFAAFEPIHRLIHAREFYCELNTFWVDHGQLPDIWLAQLSVMLALGCQATPGHIFRGSGRSAGDWTDLLLDAAQFFYRECKAITPSLTTVRALCLFVTARAMDIVKGTTVPQLVSLMGSTIRLAITMHLHRTTSLFPEIGAFEAEMRKRVWVTIQLLDVHIAMRAGASYICRDHDADAPLNLDDTDISLSERGWTINAVRHPSLGPYTDSTFQIQLTELLPLLTEIINTINSPTQKNVEHNKLMDWAAQLQQKLQEAEDALCMGMVPHHRPETADKINIQRQFLRVLVHRALMAMSHEFIITSQARQKCPIATRIVVTSAVLLLRTQMAWYSPTPHHSCHVVMTAPSRSPSPLPQTTSRKHLTSWLVDLCHDDFGAAMLYLVLVLRGRYADRIQSDEKSDIPPRAVMWSILRQSLNISGDRARQSLSHFKEFTGLSIAAGCLQSMETGEPIMPVLLEVAGEIERRVLFEGDGNGGGREVDVVGMDHGGLWASEGNIEHVHHHQPHLDDLPVDFSADLFELYLPGV